MSDPFERPEPQPGPNRTEVLRYKHLSATDFAASTDANEGFTPAHAGSWMIFWKEDICEHAQSNTQFPALPLAEAQLLWLSMEQQFFAQYSGFLRVWPEYGSSGIWEIPYPGSRMAGGMLDYDQFDLPSELVERIKAWQTEHDEFTPELPNDNDWDCFYRVADKLACGLKRHLGARTYVERVELVEVLMDGATHSWRPRLGLPERD